MTDHSTVGAGLLEPARCRSLPKKAFRRVLRKIFRKKLSGESCVRSSVKAFRRALRKIYRKSFQEYFGKFFFRLPEFSDCLDFRIALDFQIV